MLLWLWCRLAAVAPIQPRFQELLYAPDAALKRKGKKKKRKGKERKENSSEKLSIITYKNGETIIIYKALFQKKLDDL